VTGDVSVSVAAGVTVAACMAGFVFLVVLDVLVSREDVLDMVYNYRDWLVCCDGDSESGSVEGSRWRCPRCGKGMHVGVKDEHLDSHRDDGRGVTGGTKTGGRRDSGVSRGDLVDEYDPEWLDNDTGDDEIDVQLPNGGDTDVSRERLRKKWRPVLNELRTNGEVVIRDEQHVGSLRGKDAVRRFARDVKRVDVGMDVGVDVAGNRIFKR